MNTESLIPQPGIKIFFHIVNCLPDPPIGHLQFHPQRYCLKMSTGRRSKKSSEPEPQPEEWEDPDPEPASAWKRIGLQNVGNSCYLNAALQLLYVVFSYIPVSVPAPPSESPPFAICEYFPAGWYTSPGSGEMRLISWKPELLVTILG